VTPNFSHFLVKSDDGAWEERIAPLEWPLHIGVNTLAVRSVTVFGRQGRIARAQVRRWEEQTGAAAPGVALEASP
jgi:hypothetical protein